MKKNPIISKVRVFYSAVLLAALIFVQLAAFTPYIKTETLISSQNVPHTIVLDNGWKDIDSIGYAQEYSGKKIIEIERINVPVFILQLVLSALISIFVCIYPYIKKKLTQSHKNINSSSELIVIEPPYLDIDELSFADEDTSRRMQQKYARDLYDYIKKKLDTEGTRK